MLFYLGSFNIDLKEITGALSSILSMILGYDSNIIVLLSCHVTLPYNIDLSNLI